jgi:hypothetical protein
MIYYTTDRPEGLYIKHKKYKYFYTSIKDTKYWIKRYIKFSGISSIDIQTNINSAVIALLVFILLERK